MCLAGVIRVEIFNLVMLELSRAVASFPRVVNGIAAFGANAPPFIKPKSGPFFINKNLISLFETRQVE